MFAKRILAPGQSAFLSFPFAQVCSSLQLAVHVSSNFSKSSWALLPLDLVRSPAFSGVEPGPQKGMCGPKELNQPTPQQSIKAIGAQSAKYRGMSRLEKARSPRTKLLWTS
eukprot:3573643-Amphidinium_carterae.1